MRTHALNLAASTAFLLSVALPFAASAQNLVANPNFDTSLANWTSTHGAPTVSITLDTSTGSPSPPSLLFTQLQPPPALEVAHIFSECIAVSAGQAYDLVYDTVLRPTPAIASGIDAHTFSDAGCTTQTGALMGNAKDNCSALTAPWIRCQQYNQIVPAGVVAVRLRITGILLAANDPPPNTFRIDNVRFGPSGTVPVQLQSFELR